MAMSPKKKAVELVKEYTELGKDFTRGVSMHEFAKQCALKAVDNIIDALDKVLFPNPFRQYWTIVKQEIEKL